MKPPENEYGSKREKPLNRAGGKEKTFPVKGKRSTKPRRTYFTRQDLPEGGRGKKRNVAFKEMTTLSRSSVGIKERTTMVKNTTGRTSIEKVPKTKKLRKKENPKELAVKSHKVLWRDVIVKTGSGV